MVDVLYRNWDLWHHNVCGYFGYVLIILESICQELYTNLDVEILFLNLILHSCLQILKHYYYQHGGEAKFCTSKTTCS